MPGGDAAPASAATLFTRAQLAVVVQPRVFTVAEATALLPAVEQHITAARAVVDRLREAGAHLEDLAIIWGDAVSDPACEAHEEWLHYRRAFEERRDEAAATLRWFDANGIQLKDVDLGLVDFPARREGELVLLCYRAGEGDLLAWHTLEGGFAGRRPLETL